MSGDGNHDAQLKHIEEVSKNARATWFGMLGVLVFGAVAVAGVEDRDFFTYGVETALPLVGVTVPTVPFFYAAPILILAIYTYLHLYLRFYSMLSDRERRAIHFVEVDELSYREAAAELGIKLENLKMVIFRARRAARRDPRREPRRGRCETASAGA